ncbi:hypothetical protein [Paracoccus aerodenitrificans]|uniref:hypothetical protein n=1 Tax=Paracoccus aerodenitrificans TaxID=3017781 RepID=UPI0022F0A900|nr:hypothetical protein [Paracoccus aerodenitrificans]WBU63911.1 hypothetical protein PAE61_16525 [Paracoccus aerodenitrificans]
MQTYPPQSIALNTYDARHRNLAAVFEAVRSAPGRSRKEIGRDMPFSLQTMTNVVQELLDMGLIEEAEHAGGRGRGYPQRGLQIIPDRGYAIGMQIRWNACIFELVDLSFQVVDSISCPIQAEAEDAEGYLTELAAALVAFRAAHGSKDIWGIGLSGPMPIELPNIPQHDLHQPLWADQRWFNAFFRKVPVDALRKRLRDVSDLPVRMLNNPQSAALAQSAALPENLRLAYVLVGLGLGAAFANGRLISRDVWPHGGEIGHVIYGGRTLSSVLSASALRESLQMDLPQGVMEAELDRLAREEPHIFTPWLNEAAPILQFLVNFVEAAIWPDGIALGGFIPDKILELLIARSLPLPDSVVMREGDPRRTVPRLFCATRGAASIPFGAAASVLSHRANPDFPRFLAARRSPD